ncbi:MAG: hypothetical protein H3C51_06470 [Rubellimicrobium sp.]|nr:hypothetical protein [Rubellimicrobium sp.]
MALRMTLLSRLFGGRAAREAGDLLGQLQAGGGAARLGLSGPAAGVWLRLARLARGLPGPALLVVTGLLVVPALVAPGWYADRLALLAGLPEAVWWLAGALLSLAFGAHYQASEQDFTREMIDRATPPAPLDVAATGRDATLALRAETPDDNPPLAEWLALRDG